MKLRFRICVNHIMTISLYIEKVNTSLIFYITSFFVVDSLIFFDKIENRWEIVVKCGKLWYGTVNR